jgi:hypothetical protein
MTQDEKRSFMPKKIILAGIIIVFLVGIGLFFIFKQSPAGEKILQRSNPTPTALFLHPSIPQTSLWLSPDPVSIDEAGNIAIDVFIDTKENRIRALQLEIAYDPAVLQFVSLQEKDLLAGKNILINNADQKSGSIIFAAELVDDEQDAPIQGADVLATLIFRPLSKTGGRTQVRLLPQSHVSALDSDQSVLTGVTGTIVNISR